MTDPQLWLAALEIGAFFSLIALGMYLVVVGADFFNFAMGPYAMAAAMACSSSSSTTVCRCGSRCCWASPSAWRCR